MQTYTLSFLLGWQSRKTSPQASPTDRSRLAYGQCCSGQAESTQCESTCLTRTKTKGSLGAGGQLILDRDQDETDGRQGVDPDQVQWITENTDSAGVSSTRTKSNGSTGSKQSEEKGGAGEGRWESKKLCSTCEQERCRRSILAVASRNKHLGKLHIVHPGLVCYACYR